MSENAHEITYQELFEKYARREQIRSVTALVSAAAAVAGGIGAVMALRQLRADRRAVTGGTR
jgi:hypothetical protein